MKDLFSTYSIVAYDPQTGQLGAAVQTHQMCVGRILWLQPGVGGIATQSLTNFNFGPISLTMLRQGVEPAKIIEALVASDEKANRRQMAIVDSSGRAAAWTGEGCIREAGHHVGKGYSVQANMMTYRSVIPAMSKAFESATGDLAHRLLAALQAAQNEDGDIRGMQSAALKVVPADRNGPDWRVVYDLRVDEHTSPLDELARLVRLRHAQLIDDEGYRLLEEGQHQEGLQLWAKARAEAPELEEIAYWQALTLVDKYDDLATAAAILATMLRHENRREQWLELVRRLDECGLIEREGAAYALITAVVGQV